MKQRYFFNLRHSYPYIFLFLCCIPLLFLNIKQSHDWGDDFASYIHQAKNIVEGIPQTSLGYVLNTNAPGIGPPAYPIGFPLLLAPVFYFSGNSIAAFTAFLSMLLIITALLMFRYFKFYFTTLTSFFLVLIIVYNPWTLNFKMEVMSEIPFTLFLMMIIVLYRSRNEKSSYLFYAFIGFLGGYLMSVRAAGLAFIAVIVIDIIYCFLKFRKKQIDFSAFRKTELQKITMIVSALITYTMLNVVLFRMPSSGFLYYTSVFTFDSLSQKIRDNLAYNFLVIKGFFNTENAGWQFLPVFTQSAMLTFAVIGYFKKIFSKIDFIDLLVTFYFFFILVYPYGNAGFRFILPIAPVILYYAVITVKDVKIPFTLIKRKYVIILFGLLMLVQYKVGIQRITREQDDVLWGPQEDNAAEAFSYIKENVPENALVDFVKPRALALYAERNGYHMEPNQPTEKIRENIVKANIDYILYTEEPINFVPEDSLKKFVSLPNNHLECEWYNSKFWLYKVIK